MCHITFGRWRSAGSYNNWWLMDQFDAGCHPWRDPERLVGVLTMADIVPGLYAAKNVVVWDSPGSRQAGGETCLQECHMRSHLFDWKLRHGGVVKSSDAT
jgi:hypothetical protein